MKWVVLADREREVGVNLVRLPRQPRAMRV